MLSLSEQLTGCFHERVGLGLQVASTALLDFDGALGLPVKEGVDSLAHSSGRATGPARLRWRVRDNTDWVEVGR